MKILYVSSLCSVEKYSALFENKISKPSIAVQKFNRLLAEGLFENDVSVTAMSALPIIPSEDKRIFWSFGSDTSKGIKYKYLPFINIYIFRQISLLIFAFIYVTYWCLKNKDSEKVIIFDVLNLSLMISSFVASFYFNVQKVALVTDLPSMLNFSKTNQPMKIIVYKVYNKIISLFLNSFDKYILLTEQMNEKINRKYMPFIVIEGLVDSAMKSLARCKRMDKRIILYAGGLYEVFGVKNLIEAFMSLPDKDIQLSLYGSGDMIDDILKYSKLDKRIVFFGIKMNEEVVRAQLEATLLVNPRFTSSEFTKYSFPSKNMEYMVSGTPLLTTNLPGMPREYLDFVFTFSDESVAGFANTISNILSMKNDYLDSYGDAARNFVLNKKNNITQAYKILEFIS